MRGTQFIPAEVQETPFHRIPWQGIGLRQHRTIPALRLKHRSGSCGTASALPKCSIRLQYYLRFWLSSCRTSLAVSALRIMRYCLNNKADDKTIQKQLILKKISYGSLNGALVPDQDKDKFETCFVFNSEQMDSFTSGKQRSRSNIIQMLERWMHERNRIRMYTGIWCTTYKENRQVCTKVCTKVCICKRKSRRL